MNKKTTIYIMDMNQVRLDEAEVLRLIPQAYASKVLQSKNELVRKQELAVGYLLYRYLHITKDDVISYNQYGKPYCKDIHFSISHSDRYVVLAASDEEIGVDIERGSNVPLKALKRVLSREEYEQLEQKDQSELEFEKGRLWSETEAVLKAMGMGFYLEPGDQDHKKDWCLKSLKLDQYVITYAQKNPMDMEVHRALSGGNNSVSAAGDNLMLKVEPPADGRGAQKKNVVQARRAPRPSTLRRA